MHVILLDLSCVGSLLIWRFRFQCILGGVNYAAERFDSKFFEKFRSQNIVETAVQYAQVSLMNSFSILI